jgi:hypothetical protein
MSTDMPAVYGCPESECGYLISRIVEFSWVDKVAGVPAFDCAQVGVPLSVSSVLKSGSVRFGCSDRHGCSTWAELQATWAARPSVFALASLLSRLAVGWIEVVSLASSRVQELMTEPALSAQFSAFLVCRVSETSRSETKARPFPLALFIYVERHWAAYV